MRIYVETPKDSCKGAVWLKKHCILCFVLMVEGFGFRLSRVSRSHHIFVHAKVKELVNLQEVGGQIKPYQMKQFMNLVERYDLELEEE